MKRVNFHLSDQQIGALRERAEQTGLTVAELIRRAVDEFLKRHH
jgi:predicted DNA binding CopG/RHH family protein